MKLLTLLMLCCSFAACSLFRPNIEPQVSVVDLAVTDVTLLETTMLFRVRVTNPGENSLELNGSSHKFYINDSFIGSGSSDETFVIPRFGSTVQTVTVHLSNLSMVRRIESLINQGRLEYEVDSVLYPKQSGWFSRIRTSSSGSFQPGEWSKKNLGGNSSAGFRL